MDRREALQRVALIMGGAVIGAEAFLSGCKTTPAKEGLFSADDIALLDEVGDTILPATSSPGAKAAQIGEFMKTMVADCYAEDDQKIFTDGITKLQDAAKKKYSKSFMEMSPEQRTEFLVELDKEAKARSQEIGARAAKLTDEQRHQIALDKNLGTFKRDPQDDPHYFTMIKQLTLTGYFTSKPGATQALRYIAVPGKYEGCIPYKKGDKAWAT
ncbi:gluconate 2-dehydrogenase subunit 3 family protein [Parafilimonas sp.]|uniref:gluconate 2-dehydrogenase subunit 3 family protein n=1 Tax=Parafilimonas sp. TaxID=1969739 RepID=UPI0039E4E8A0